MAANTNPIMTLTPNIGWANITSAQTDLTGVLGTLIYTAGSSGSMTNSLIVKSTTTNATSAAATLRIFLNNGSTVGTSTNNSLIREYTLGAVTASSTAATLNYQFPLNLQLPAGYKIYAEIATMAGSTGWQVTVDGGDY